MEDLYGAVLAVEFGDYSPDDVANMSNQELVDGCDRVRQDVECTIDLGDTDIVGEADWTILYGGTDPIDHVHLDDGARRVTYADGTERHLDPDETPPIEKVVETKTSKIKWREKYGHKFEHEYQVRTYMWAFDAYGEIVYIQRDDLDELVFELVRGSDVEDDMSFRAQRLHMMIDEARLPDADPPRDNICKYCDFRDECKVEGGTRWQ
jgi:hypothetical protein